MGLIAFSQAHALDLQVSSFVPSASKWLQKTFNLINKWHLFGYLGAMSQLLILIFFFKNTIEAWTTRNAGFFTRTLLISCVATVLINDAVKGGSYTNKIYRIPINAWGKVYDSASKSLNSEVKNGIAKNTKELAVSMQGFVTNSMMGLGTMSNLSANSMYKAAIGDPSSATAQQDGSLAVKQVWDAQQAFYNKQRGKIEGITWAYQLGYLILMGFFMAFAGVVYFSGMSIILAMFAFPPALAFWAGGNGRPIRIIFGTCLVAIATVAILPSIMLVVTDMALSQPTTILKGAIDKENAQASAAANTYASNLINCYAQAQKTASAPVVGGAVKTIDRTMCAVSSNAPIVFSEIGRVLMRVIMGLAMMVITMIMGISIGAALIRLVPTYLTPIFEGGPGGSDHTSLGSVGRTAMQAAATAGTIASTVAAPLAAGAMRMANGADNRLQAADAGIGRMISQSSSDNKAVDRMLDSGGSSRSAGGSSNFGGGGASFSPGGSPKGLGPQGPSSGGAGAVASGSQATGGTGVGIPGVQVSNTPSASTAPGASTTPTPSVPAGVAPSGAGSPPPIRTASGASTPPMIAGGQVAPAQLSGNLPQGEPLPNISTQPLPAQDPGGERLPAATPAAGLTGNDQTHQHTGVEPRMTTDAGGTSNRAAPAAPQSTALGDTENASTSQGSSAGGEQTSTPLAASSNATSGSPITAEASASAAPADTADTPSSQAPTSTPSQEQMDMAAVTTAAGVTSMASISNDQTSSQNSEAGTHRSQDINEAGKAALPLSPAERTERQSNRAQAMTKLRADRQTKQDEKNPPKLTELAARQARALGGQAVGAAYSAGTRGFENARRNGIAASQAARHNNAEMQKQQADPGYTPSFTTPQETRTQMERNGDFDKSRDAAAVRNVLAAHNAAEARQAALDPSYVPQKLNAEEVRETLAATGNLPHQRAGNDYRARELQESWREDESAKQQVDPTYKPTTLSSEEAHARNAQNGNTVQHDEGYLQKPEARDDVSGKAEGEATAAAAVSPARGDRLNRSEQARSNLKDDMTHLRPPRGEHFYNSVEGVEPGEGKPGKDGKLPTTKLTYEDRVAIAAVAKQNELAGRPYQSHSEIERDMRQNGTLPSYQQANQQLIAQRAESKGISQTQAATELKQEKALTEDRHRPNTAVPFKTRDEEVRADATRAAYNTHERQRASNDPGYQPQYVTREQQYRSLRNAAQEEQVNQRQATSAASSQYAEAMGEAQGAYAHRLSTDYNAGEARRAQADPSYTARPITSGDVNAMLAESRASTIASAQAYPADSAGKTFDSPEEARYAHALAAQHNNSEETRAQQDSNYTPKPVTPEQISEAIYAQKYPDTPPASLPQTNETSIPVTPIPTEEREPLPASPATEPSRQTRAADISPPASSQDARPSEQVNTANQQTSVGAREAVAASSEQTAPGSQTETQADTAPPQPFPPIVESSDEQHAQVNTPVSATTERQPSSANTRAVPLPQEGNATTAQSILQPTPAVTPASPAAQAATRPQTASQPAATNPATPTATPVTPAEPMSAASPASTNEGQAQLSKLQAQRNKRLKK